VKLVRVARREACEQCGGVVFEVSATLIRCRSCGLTYGRCEGRWRLDTTTLRREAAHRMGVLPS
jgi:hypothetical protein